MIRPAAHCLVLSCFSSRVFGGIWIPQAIQNPFRFAAPGNIQSMAFDSVDNLYLAGVSALSIGDISLPEATTIIGASQGSAVFVEKISPSLDHTPEAVEVWIMELQRLCQGDCWGGTLRSMLTTGGSAKPGGYSR